MRIAVCLSGAERLDSHALTLFARALPPDAAVDCFCFVWEGGPLGEADALRESLATKTEQRFAHLEVEIGRGFVVDMAMVVQKWPETNIENVLRMFRAIRHCNGMKLRHEVASGFTYDCVIRTRTDLALASEVEFARFLPMVRDFIIFPENGHWRGGLNDQFAFSSSASMDAYASLADHIAEHCSNGCVFHPETLLRFHLMKLRKYPILAPITARVLRD